MIPPHLAQGTQHSQADPCPASLQFGVLVFLGPQKSPPGLVWGPHRATLLVFKGLSFPQQWAWPRPSPGEQACANPRTPLLLVLWSRLSLSLSSFLLWTQDTGSLELLWGKKSSEGQKILESSFSGWPWTSHFISQNPFCKHGCALPYNLVRRRPALSESTIFFMTGGQGWHRGSTLRGLPVTGRAWLSPQAQTGCRHRQVLPGGLLCWPHPPWEPRPHLLRLSWSRSPLGARRQGQPGHHPCWLTASGREEDSRVTLLIPAEATYPLQSSKSVLGLVNISVGSRKLFKQ